MAILKEQTGLSNEDIRKLRSLRPGSQLDIQITTPTVTKRARTEFVGMDGTRSIIMQYPDEAKWGAIRELIYVDNTLIVRAILEDETGEVIAFKVKISMILNKPGQLIFTSFPLSLQSIDLRAEKRAKTSIPVTLSDEQGNNLIASGLIKDISNSGCRVEVEKKKIRHKLTAKQQISLRLTNSNTEQGNLTGTIMNAKGEGTKNYYGVKFEQSEGVVDKLLERLMITL